MNDKRTSFPIYIPPSSLACMSGAGRGAQRRRDVFSNVVWQRIVVLPPKHIFYNTYSADAIQKRGLRTKWVALRTLCKINVDATVNAQPREKRPLRGTTGDDHDFRRFRGWRGTSCLPRRPRAPRHLDDISTPLLCFLAFAFALSRIRGSAGACLLHGCADVRITGGRGVLAPVGRCRG